MQFKPYFFLFLLIPFVTLSQTQQSFQLFYDYNAKQPIKDNHLGDFEHFIATNKEVKFIKITVEVFSDTIGNEAGNFRMGELRFQAIKAYLSQLLFLPEITFTNKSSERQRATREASEKARTATILFEFPIEIPPKEEEIVRVYESELVLEEPQKTKEENPASVSPFKGKTLVSSILFAGDQATYSGNPYKSLNYILSIYKKNPELFLRISGHTCCGNKVALSRQRARRVYLDLIYLGIPKKQMTYTGYGNQRPLVDEVDEKSMRKNRRVEIEFY